MKLFGLEKRKLKNSSKDRFYNMKTFLAVAAFLLTNSYIISAQNIFSVEYSHQADVKAFVVDYAHQADLLVYKVEYAHQVKGNEGLWFFTEYAHQADKKIFFTEYAHQADLKIFFVKYNHQTEWKDKSKIHLLF